ncbi:beta-ketoacyl-ACP synthase II [Treponema parvum]|uniref:3-oxoacyl-[acyl-carrier-protein] synthase 2 n=1 Tax=Treponema parvum TaxID=138851 RepID=A0A975F2H0_9SPIR|nr:beta-ketoacyl-ACP synthase II [Treponema parvum]QTQ13331.1 beta-ketoacyl-ACP synthase II [Treponema parvum]QTQ15560.1 beta-ketoacyl-ACP synthase II [Treponema parvum]
MAQRRVVITGMGAVTPLGNSVEETWAGVKAGKSGIAPITHFDTSDINVKYAAEIKHFDASKYMDPKEARKMARFTKYAVAAARMALEDANLIDNKEVLDNAGVFLGVGIGGFEVTEEGCIRYHESNHQRVPPMTIPELIPNEAAGNICMQFGIHGLSHTVATACASGCDALGDALDLIRAGRLDVCLSGGAESTVNGYAMVAFDVLQTLSKSFTDDPTKASRPFDKKREGFVMGEGSAILILEEYEHAKKRGAKIYAELAGYGASSDAYHLTSPDPSGVCGSRCMIAAMKDAGVKPEDIQYYNAHGTSTHINDPSETKMIKLAFGEEQAKKLKISSTKSMTGHCLGATGAIEAMICVKAIEDGFFPATINLDEPDVEGGCDLDYIPNKGYEGKIDCAMSTNFGFGGHNGAVVIKKMK